MPPTLALLLWLVLLLVLLCFDPAKVRGTSLALWVPLIWMFFTVTRLPSQWLGSGTFPPSQVALATAQAAEDGNPTDRMIFFVLIVLMFLILIFRSFRWGDFVSRNFALIAFLFFALLSVLWSDFSFVTFKRWFRDLGNYTAILVVLSDPRPSDAIRTVLRRLYYLVIPLSVVMLKYYPFSAEFYDPWTGIPENCGVATSKNTLGALCMMSGIFFFWDTVTRLSQWKERRAKRILLVDGVFLAMIFWLLQMSNSATSRVCLAIGCLVVLLVNSNWARRHPVFLKLLIPGCFIIYLILAYGFGLNAELTKQLGRDPTLTGRTDVWSAVLSVHTNPLLGTGYQTFWLGPRREEVVRRSGVYAEAHNGYLETYVNLGILGLLLLAWLLASSYRRLCRSLMQFTNLTPLMWGLASIVLFYNMTESAFGATFMCVTFLWGTITLVGQGPAVTASLSTSFRASGPLLEPTRSH